MKRVVWASSETVLGLPFDTPPAFAPIDESIEPRPESSYSLSKLVGETMAAQFVRRTGIPIVGLRISNIMEPDDYQPSPRTGTTSRSVTGTCGVTSTAGMSRRRADERCGGRQRAKIAIVAAADTVMPQSSAH